MGVNRFGESLKYKYTLCIRDLHDQERTDKILEKVEITFPEQYNFKKSVLKQENGWKLTDFACEEVVQVKCKLYFQYYTDVQEFTLSMISIVLKKEIILTSK